jgi:hypothetical protein
MIEMTLDVNRAFSAWCFELIQFLRRRPRLKMTLRRWRSTCSAARAAPLQRFNALTLQPRSPIRDIRVIRGSHSFCPICFFEDEREDEDENLRCSESAGRTD